MVINCMNAIYNDQIKIISIIEAPFFRLSKYSNTSAHRKLKIRFFSNFNPKEVLLCHLLTKMVT